FLHLMKRRVRCPEDGSIHVEALDWIKPRARVPHRFAGHVYRLTAITTNAEAGWYLDLDDEQVYRIDWGKLEELAREKLIPPPAAKNISVDEVSWLKYHRYWTIVIDTDIKQVVWDAQGRKKEVLNTYDTAIGHENCDRIESVALDGARTYISSTQTYASKARIVYDRFHVTQKLTGAVDATRRDELSIARAEKRFELVELMGAKQRLILLKNKSNRTERQAGSLQRLCEINEPIYKAMLLKESFQEIDPQHTVEDAKRCLESWIEQALASGLKAFVILAESFREKMTFILNWFRKKIHSAISEGFNNKIKRLKRRAYGDRDAGYFLLKIHQHCGLLNPRFQH
ncbi:MAG: ISL3 family transposase, partial [Candidatus Omnitrophica bacterium]|nr:ISL3 family transposase [Candidatus Omnitrophota bacterium]